MTEGYDNFSTAYDRFVNWKNRLGFEKPFLHAQLQALGPLDTLTILDAATGTGMHALALARDGCQAVGADISSGMVAQARRNAAAAGLEVPFHEIGFGDLGKTFPANHFDAVLVLGNSLPHLLTPLAVEAALRDMRQVLKPGGLLLIQNRNFDAVLRNKERWMEPQAAADGEEEWAFVRHYDFLPDGLIEFHVITLQRSQGGGWRQAISSTLLRPQPAAELTQLLQTSGFGEIVLYGGLDGSEWNAENSGNLVVSARAA